MCYIQLNFLNIVYFDNVSLYQLTLPSIPRCSNRSSGQNHCIFFCRKGYTQDIKWNHPIVKCRRWRAVSTLSEATGFRPRKVVRLFRSASDIESSNLAIHSSANELLTTLTPVKSSTTRSFCSIIGNKSSRTRLPNGRVPKFSPYSLKLNVTTIVRLVFSLFGCKVTLFFRDMQEKSLLR